MRAPELSSSTVCSGMERPRRLRGPQRRPGNTAGAIVRGRRRQGKSYLLRRLAQADGRLLLPGGRGGAEPGTRRVRRGARRAPRCARWPAGARIAGTTRSGRSARCPLDNRGPRTVVLDEFPYLLSHSPGAAVVAPAVHRSTPRMRPMSLRLILCGSALSVMAKLLEGAQALRGRASVDIVMRTFDYRNAAEFWDIADPTTAFLVHAVVGGTPGIPRPAAGDAAEAQSRTSPSGSPLVRSTRRARCSARTTTCSRRNARSPIGSSTTPWSRRSPAAPRAKAPSRKRSSESNGPSNIPSARSRMPDSSSPPTTRSAHDARSTGSPTRSCASITP
jgi:hypothetical protein